MTFGRKPVITFKIRIEQLNQVPVPGGSASLTSDKTIGSALFVGSLVGIAFYGYILYYWPVLVLQLTAFTGVALLLGIIAWIGYTMATTPPPEPITDIPEPKPASQEKAAETK